VVRRTLTTDRLTLRPSSDTIHNIGVTAGRPSFTLSMALRDAKELSSRLHARLDTRLVVALLKTVKFFCYSLESSLKLRFLRMEAAASLGRLWKRSNQAYQFLSHRSHKPILITQKFLVTTDRPKQIPAVHRPNEVLFLQGLGVSALSPWRPKRIRLGHPSPFKSTHVQIGRWGHSPDASH
jgi:hypothetical protein